MALNRFTLDNGLRVVHHEDRATAMVAVNVIYDVGARDEEPHLTGMAHLFEHLMFSGSENIPKYDAAIERAGGQNNAWTSQDFTSFYDVCPAVNAETLFWLESDRMLSLAFNPKGLEVQRQVVIEEFKQTCLNRPYGTISHHLNALLYKEHPYRVPVIGREIADLERVTMDDIKRFFFSHYAPNNAVLAVCGNISLERTKELAQKYFGPIERRDIAPRTYPREADIKEPRREEMTGMGPQILVMTAFPMGGMDSPDYIPADLISDILASGRSSRMFRELVLEGGLLSEADASISGSVEPGYFLLRGALLRDDEESVGRAEKLLLEQVERVKAEGVTPHELERALNRFDSRHTFGNLNYLTRCQQMAIAEIEGRDAEHVVDRYREVTLDDIQRTAQRIFRDRSRVTLIHRPQPGD